MATTTLAVPDLTCANCVAHIRAALAGVPGLPGSSIDQARRQVRLDTADPAVVAAARARLDDAGYPATVIAG